MNALRIVFAALSVAFASPAFASNAPRDGAHDFDFDFGHWKTHSRRLMHPLSGAKDWIEMDGTSDVEPLWGGKANIAEFSADGPNGHLEIIALRVYNTTTRQWSVNFATPTVGKLGEVPGIGEFHD